MKTDTCHETIVQYQRFIRKELVLWFGIMVSSIFVLIYTYIQWYAVSSYDYNRGYIAVTDEGTPLYPTRLTKPHPTLTAEDIKSWVERELQRCMTFDRYSYETTKARCSAEIFSTNRTFDDSYSLGQTFYQALEVAEVISVLKANNTSMTIEILDSKFMNEGVKVYRSPAPEKMRDRAYYTYNYRIEFKVMMHGQDLDAPIKYDVAVERMLETNRRLGIGIRSVISR